MVHKHQLHNFLEFHSEFNFLQIYNILILLLILFKKKKDHYHRKLFQRH